MHVGRPKDRLPTPIFLESGVQIKWTPALKNGCRQSILKSHTQNVWKPSSMICIFCRSKAGTYRFYSAKFSKIKKINSEISMYSPVISTNFLASVLQQCRLSTVATHFYFGFFRSQSTSSVLLGEVNYKIKGESWRVGSCHMFICR